MNNSQLFDSLLHRLTSDQVQDIINENILIAKGYSIEYVVDQFEIGIYCFPFGLKVNDERQNLPTELITDEQIAHHSLFQSKTINFHFFDEYLVELNKLIDIVNLSKKLSIKIFDNLEKFKTELYGMPELSEWGGDFSKLNQYNFSLLISLAIEAISEGIEKKNKIFNRKTAIVTKKDILNSNISNIVKDILLKSRPSKLTNQLYNELKLQLYDNPSDEQIKRNFKLRNQLLSKYRDCKVIDRVFSINKQISLTDEKYIFLFLSSTKNINDLFNLPFIKSKFSTFSGIEINPHRTSAQLFLNFICFEEGKTIENLLAVKKIIQIGEGTVTDNINKEEQKIIDQRIRKIDGYRKEFKNLAILDQYSQYKDIIDKAKKKIEDDQIVNTFNELIKIIVQDKKKKEINRLKKLTLNEIKLERNFIAALISGIYDIEKGQDFNVSKGKDYIKGIYHRLPIVFKISNPEYRQIIDKITGLFLAIDVKNMNSKSLLYFIRRSVILLFEQSIPVEEEKIVRCLVFFMLPSTSSVDTDEIALQRLEEILNFEIDESNPNNLKQEFLYLASWAARRCRKYDEAKAFARKGLDNNKDDARFYHALSLIDYCLFKEAQVSKRIFEESYLLKAIENSQIALNLNYNIENPSIEIQKSSIALLNNKIYFYCLLYGHSQKDDSYLRTASDLLETIKEEEPNFYLFPEFIHTEVYLIYLKAHYLKYATEIKIAYLEQAKNLIRKAIALSPQDDDYLLCEDKLFRLQTMYKNNSSDSESFKHP